MTATERVADAFGDDSVVVSVLIAAAPETVWRFLSDPERFAAWLGAFAGQAPLPGTRVEPRVGGAVRVEYPGGHVACGMITAVEPLRRVAFTWGYEVGHADFGPGSTQVEILLRAVEGGTLVELRHSGLPSRAEAQGHFGGWKHYLAMLARMASAGQHAETLSRVTEAYFAAWSEADGAARRRLLEACCEPDVRVRTAWACTDSIDELSAHIANGQKHMPGMTLKADGAPQVVHGSARVAWVVVTPDGAAALRGVNFMTMALGGRIRALTSFAAS